MRKYATLTIAQARNPHSVPRVVTYFGHLEKIYAERRNIIDNLAGKYHIWEKTGTCAECFEVFRKNLRQLIDRYFDDDANLKRALREDFHFVFDEKEEQDDCLFSVASCYYYTNFDTKDMDRILYFGRKEDLIKKVNEIRKEYIIRNVFKENYKTEKEMFQETFRLLALDILCSKTKKEALHYLENTYFLKEERKMQKYKHSPEHPYFAGTFFVEKKENDKFFKSVFFVCGEREEVEKFEQEQKQNFRVSTYGYLFRTWEEALEGLKRELIEWIQSCRSVDELSDSLEILQEKVKILSKAS